MPDNKERSKVKRFELSPELYDMRVNWPKRLLKEKDFLIGLLKKRNVGSILDIGCGTAHHAQLLSGFVNNIVAIDPSKKSIDYAKEKVVTSDNIKLLVAGFENMEDSVPGNFDLVICLGNTLSILGSRRKVKIALKTVRKKLTRGGLAVFQFLNYEPKMVERERFYEPKIIKKGGTKYIFLKHFEYGKIKTRVDLLVIQLDRDDNIEDFYNNSSYLCTLRKNLFIKMAYNSGYKKVELFGTGGNEAFDKNKHVSLYALLYN